MPVHLETIFGDILFGDLFGQDLFFLLQQGKLFLHRLAFLLFFGQSAVLDLRGQLIIIAPFRVLLLQAQLVGFLLQVAQFVDQLLFLLPVGLDLVALDFQQVKVGQKDLQFFLGIPAALFFQGLALDLQLRDAPFQLVQLLGLANPFRCATWTRIRR